MVTADRYRHNASADNFIERLLDGAVTALEFKGRWNPGIANV
jgi:hypothetical protein